MFTLASLVFCGADYFTKSICRRSPRFLHPTNLLAPCRYRAGSPRRPRLPPPTSATHLVSCQLTVPDHAPQAATAPLQNLSSKLVKARHCLHAVNLQVETIRSECDKARREVEASDTEISGMEHEEERLKLQYVESAPAGSQVSVELQSGRAAPPGSLLPLEPVARRASR